MPSSTAGADLPSLVVIGERQLEVSWLSSKTQRKCMRDAVSIPDQVLGLGLSAAGLSLKYGDTAASRGVVHLPFASDIRQMRLRGGPRRNDPSGGELA